jgi:hypothetical protein
MVTVRNLSITSWQRDPNDPLLTIAVPGIQLTGWWRYEAPNVERIASLEAIWRNEDATVKIIQDLFEDRDGKRRQLYAYVRISRYPSDWLTILESSLALFITQGAVIAWAGGFESLDHYAPDVDFVACYAAYTRRTGLICFSDLDEPFISLDSVPEAVQGLHRAVAEELRASG